VVVTEWNEFKNVDLPRVRDSMRRPVVIDGRNIYDPERMLAVGFTYRGVGRGYAGSGARGEAWDQAETRAHAAQEAVAIPVEPVGEAEQAESRGAQAGSD